MTIQIQNTALTKDQAIALRGLRFPKQIVHRFKDAGIYCEPSVSIEYQQLSQIHVLCGRESGGATEQLGAYCCFVEANGGAISWVDRIRAVGRNGLHAIVVAPELVRLHAFRDGQMYSLLVTRHRLITQPGRKRPTLENTILFYGFYGYLALELWGKDKHFSGSALPIFNAKGGERLSIPAPFERAARTVIAATNCIVCDHSHCAEPPNATMAKPTPEEPAPATEFCLECHAVLTIQVCHSAAGYFIGTECESCGPHSRFSGYTRKQESAEAVLNAFLRNPCRLGGYFLCDTNLTSVELLCYEKSPGEFTAKYYGSLGGGLSHSQ